MALPNITVPLKTLIETRKGISYGIVQPGPFVNAGIPIVRVGDIKDNRVNTDTPLRVDQAVEANYLRTRLRGGELLITVVGAPGQTAIASPSLAGWNVARAIAVLPIREDIGAYWVQLALQSPLVKGLIDSRLNTTVQPTLNLADLAELPILCPEKPERDRIISIIKPINDKIELNRQMNETLEAMARAIFKDWFVDFGPTRAKMEGRAPYLAPDIWPLFPDRLDDEGKPEGWEETPLSDVFDIIGGGTPKTSVESYWNGDIQWFSVVDTPPSGDLFVFKTEKTITKLGLSESSACLVPAGTTIISARGTVGNLAIVAQDMAFNQSCYALNGKSCFGRYFVFLTAKNMVSKLQSMSHGSVFSTITRSTFEAITSIKPTNETLKIFEKIIEPIFVRIRENAIQSITLSDKRDILLPKLMSGEIQVRDAEKVLESIS